METTRLSWFIMKQVLSHQRKLLLSQRLTCQISTIRHFGSESEHHGHNAINIKESSQGNTKRLTKEELEARQKAMMGRNLPKRRPVEGVKKVVLVSSGKGGVGKSTVAVNLAVGMKQLFPSKDISLLDADVFGPSLPRMMNLSGEPFLNDDNKMIPLQNYGVKCMSMGFLVSEGAPVVWRGLMVMSAIEKLVRGVAWAPSDVLFVDMPPGTGDTQLSFAQSVEVDGAIIVTTPQQVAIQDAIKGVEMFKKTNVPIIGCILNMSSYICSSCGSETKVKSNINRLTDDLSIELLGDLPLDLEVSNACDEGHPIVLDSEKHLQGRKFETIVKKITGKLNIT
ncbi:unnamed protein product [Orchesella dallaii]|uniref:Iron-sulfur protein NUBPL n=1 Tax=Orchesella dallaii TaxID=48710 RepID=A0ABP1S5P4_9HEXA